ncbi:site-specific DNA-methyltransferase [Yersinia mollaretii]|uniref:site-specific DNA-methyltransferase n=1 Tax=Yersinia mollaretii TaxID=33060 RepID=UPI000C1F043D|nr:site-specific DNA-methyltransferase [Yersinia mollaretii]PJE89616.1 site-specific DNA-methyltransferase [Yersinia mollaretii]
MEKLKMHSPNLTQDNIARIRDLFPGCVTEAKGEDGTVKLAVDFDQLRQELAESIVEGPQERYHLNWPGKREALLAANAPIAKTLRPCREESVNFDSTKNLFIEGDNLDALKLLQEAYLGKVKLIYIDPPYNTGNDFIYEDDFAEDTHEYLRRSNQVDAEGNRLVANAASNGRFHSDWLSMIYPRLKIARNMLTEDGVLFISADYHESANLRRLCDEIFGEQSFQADISWQKRYTRSNNTQDFTTVVEHILVYSRSDAFIVNLLPRTEEADGRYSNPDNDPRGPWKGASFLNPATPEQRPNLCYPITNPNTGSTTTPTTNAWRRSKEEFDRLQNEGLLYWGGDGRVPVPSIKMFLSEARGLTPINFWEHTYAGNTDDGTRDVLSLFGNKVFDNPKPVQLMKRILEHATASDSLILDFFAGSGSMAHAVLEKNLEDGGTRRFIMVQIDEETPNDSTANKVGYRTISEVSKERIRRACKKVGEDHAKVDTGFRVLKIDTSNMADVYYTPDALDEANLDLFVNNIKPDRTPEDLLFQVMLDWGVDLALPITKQSIQGKDVFFVDGNVLAACFDATGSIDEAFVKELAKLQPLRVVFRDAGFKNSAVKINVEQIFTLMSPVTEVKCI